MHQNGLLLILFILFKFQQTENSQIRDVGAFASAIEQEVRIKLKML